MNEETMTTTAAKMMLDAMKRLNNKEITPQEAQGIAVLGKGVIDAAQAEIQFIKTCKAMPKNGLFGTQMIYLEPECSKDALLEQRLRIEQQERGIK